MLPINYNHLYYFWVIAKAGSISSATKTLLLTQPTLSMEMGQLDRFVGRKLLVRGRVGVTPTPEGALLFQHCERIFSRTEEIIPLFRGETLAATGVLRLGVATPLSREKVLRVLERIRSACS